MTIRTEDSTIQLMGLCGHDDVESLLAALTDHPDLPIDLTAATHLHGAILQLLMRAGRRIEGEPLDAFVSTWLRPILQRG
jgi:hypothetical protein